MFSLAMLALFARLVTAAPAVDVTLSSSGNPLDVTATVANTGPDGVSVMTLSPLLTEIPIQHVRVFDAEGTELPFYGVNVFFDYDHAGAEAWESIAAGQKISRTIDLSASYELKSAGQYTVWAQGKFRLIDNAYSADALKAATVVSYSQNLTISLTEDDVKAAERRELFQKRVSINSNCNANQAAVLRDAFAGAKRMAIRAAERTRAVDSRFVQFYNTNDAHYVDFVADTFDKIDNAATVAATSNIVSGCVGSTNICTGNVIAYASHVVGTQGRGTISTCSNFWALPPYPATCDGYGQADVMLHELSHHYDTTDHTYGWSASQNLSPAEAAHNADTYMFYARSLNC